MPQIPNTETASILALRNPQWDWALTCSLTHSALVPFSSLSQLLISLLVLPGITAFSCFWAPNLKHCPCPAAWALSVCTSLTRYKQLKGRDCSTSSFYPQCFEFSLEHECSVIAVEWMNNSSIGPNNINNNIQHLLTHIMYLSLFSISGQ